MNKKAHSMIIENRTLLRISGVTDTVKFDENIFVFFTEMGKITIKGENLHAENLNLESGELTIKCNTVDSIVYSDGKRNFWGKITK